MAESAPDRRMTVDEFIRFDDGTDTRYELVDGQLVAMAPPLERHGTIASNLIMHIGPKLRPPCRVVNNAGIRFPERDDVYFVADLAVTCAEPDRDRRWVEAPRVVVEVTSPSTDWHDRRRKLWDYAEFLPVEDIVVVDTERRRVQHWRRDGERWIVVNLIGDATLDLALAGPIPLDAIYAGSGV